MCGCTLAATVFVKTVAQVKRCWDASLSVGQASFPADLVGSLKTGPILKVVELWS